ncbi:MAG: PHB depolymerase family esterase [Potamolinea sp.]
MNISTKKLLPLAILVFLVSISLTTAFRSIQAQERDKTKEAISKTDDSGKLNHQGKLRTYELYTPSSYNANRPMPLVMVFHGHDGTGASIAEVTRFNELAEKKGFIVVYPDGINHNWNLIGNYSGKEDDVSFVTALLDQMKQIRNIDSRKIYAAGFSKGAIFTQNLACELPDKFAAFASVAGALPVRLQPKCQPNTPVSMLMINGTNDSAVLYEGDEINKKGALVSVPETVDFWLAHNKCTSPTEVKQLPTAKPNNRFKVQLSRYSDCSNGSEVILDAILEGGHSWPGGASKDASLNQFNANLGFNASETIWNFFERHALR